MANQKWQELLIQEYGGNAVENGNNSYSLELNNCLVNMEPKDDHLFLYTSIAILPQNVDKEIYECLLELNFLGLGSGGGHVGLHKDTRILVYSLIVELDTLDAHRLRNNLMLFVNKAVEIIKKYEEVVSEAEKDNTAEILSSINLGNVVWG